MLLPARLYHPKMTTSIACISKHWPPLPRAKTHLWSQNRKTMDPHRNHNNGLLLKRQQQLMNRLQGKIKGYLIQVGTVGDSAALKLLNKTMDLLEKQKQFDNNGTTTLNSFSDTLKIIQLLLARIENKNLTPPEPRNYATIVAQNSPKGSETSTMLL